MKKIGLFLMIASTIVSLLGCGSAKTERSMDLVVVEQTDSVYGNNENNDYEWASLTVDVPVDGPK